MNLLSRVGLIRDRAGAGEKLARQMAEYAAGAACLRANPGLLPKLLGLTALQLSVQFAVPYLVYCAFGLEGHALPLFLGTQAVVTLAVCSLPLPGSVGPAEGGLPDRIHPPLWGGSGHPRHAGEPGNQLLRVPSGERLRHSGGSPAGERAGPCRTLSESGPARAQPLRYPAADFWENRPPGFCMAAGCVTIDTKIRPAALGRPLEKWGYHMYYLGIDLGGTNVAAAAVSEEGEILGRASISTSRMGADTVAAQMAEAVRLAACDAGLKMEEAASLGIGSPGTIDPERGVIQYWSNLDFRNVPLVQLLRAKLECEMPIYMENDANAAALGEYAAGAGKGSQSMVAITLGTGVGGRRRVPRQALHRLQLCRHGGGPLCARARRTAVHLRPEGLF